MNKKDYIIIKEKIILQEKDNLVKIKEEIKRKSDNKLENFNLEKPKKNK